jgi:hypothetical protein
MAKEGNTNKGGCYCRPDRRGKGLLGRTSTKWCHECGFRIRGSVKAHNEGDRHKGIVPKRKKW